MQSLTSIPEFEETRMNKHKGNSIKNVKLPPKIKTHKIKKFNIKK